MTGNILVSFVITPILGSQSFTPSTAGWIPGGSIFDANSSAAWFWRPIDGTQVQGIYTWDGSFTKALSNTIQVRGASATNPIGTATENIGSGTSLDIGAMTANRDGSTIMAILVRFGQQRDSSANEFYLNCRR